MTFEGWPVEAIEFFERLEDDNTKSFWTEHKGEYETAVRAPMEALLVDLAESRGEGKIFRPYRDVRFSKDKTPYKTNIAGTMEKGGYVSLSADAFSVGTGYYMMAKDQLARFRAAIDDDRRVASSSASSPSSTDAGIEVTAHDTLKTAPAATRRTTPASNCCA